MVSNYDRIYLEIARHAEEIEQTYGVNARDLTTLVMEIVDLEDQNRIKPLAINKQITHMVDQAAKRHVREKRVI